MYKDDIVLPTQPLQMDSPLQDQVSEDSLDSETTTTEGESIGDETSSSDRGPDLSEST